jgi:hypothetical protein
VVAEGSVGQDRAETECLEGALDGVISSMTRDLMREVEDRDEMDDIDGSSSAEIWESVGTEVRSG